MKALDRWPLFAGLAVAGAAAVVASATTLAALAEGAGWTAWTPWLLPASLDVGTGVGVWCWLRPGVPEPARLFAQKLAVVGSVATLAGNAAGHLLASSFLQSGPALVVIVGAAPAAMLVALAHLAALLVVPAPADSSHESATDQPEQPAPAQTPDPTGSTPALPPGEASPVGSGPTYSTRSSRPRSGGRRLPRSMRRRSDRAAESAPAPEPIVDTDRIAALIEDIWTRSDRRRSAPDRGPRRPAAPKSDRVDDDLRLELTRLIAAKKLPPQPTAEAIRTTLRIAPDKARQLREERKALQDQDATDGNKEPEVARG